MNEPLSFMGLDLGEERYLFPTCYTIRNRISSTHVMLNWVLEGSNNGNDWFILDKRIHFSSDQEFNVVMEKEREMLKIKGGTSTWGIDTNGL